MNVGDRVYWRHESGPGDERVNRVPAVVEAIEGSRVLIRVALRSPCGWQRASRLAPWEQLSPRTAPVPEVDD